MALPLMRIATREAEHLQNRTQPKVLTMAEATRWAKDVMRVLSLRSAQCSNRIQIATVSADGVDLLLSDGDVLPADAPQPLLLKCLEVHVRVLPMAVTHGVGFVQIGV